MVEHLPGPKRSFAVWYAKNLRTVGMGYSFCLEHGLMPDPEQLDKTHVFVGTVEAASEEAVFRSLNIEARSGPVVDKIKSLCLAEVIQHSSMSVGDCIVEVASYLPDLGNVDVVRMVDRLGFKAIPSKPPLVDGSFYWVSVPKIDPRQPFMVGRLCMAGSCWEVNGEHFSVEKHEVHPLSLIDRPKELE